MAYKRTNYSKLVLNISDEEKSSVLPMAASIAKGRTDPVYFGEYFLGLRFHPGQKIWLWLTTKTQIKNASLLAEQIDTKLPSYEKLIEHPFLKNILCPSNRWGKTLSTAVKHIWYNFYKIGCKGTPSYIKDIRYPTLNISPHSNQVDAAYRYIVDIFNDKFIYFWEGNQIRNICKIKSFLLAHKQTRREIIFNNNAYIKGVPTGEDQASSLAGTQFFYISYDEAPQSLHLRKELPAKIQSRLIDSGGPLDIIGTPEVDKPSHAYYERIAKKGIKLKDGFFLLIGKLKDNIFIGEKEKETTLEAIRQTDPEKYRQVAFGEFVSSGSKLLPNVAVERLWDDSIVKLEMGIPGRDYIIGVDWDFSDTGDPSVFYIIDYTELMTLVRKGKKTDMNKVLYHIIFRESIKGGSPYAVLARLKILQQDFNDAKIIHDSSSMGGVIIKKMLHEMHVRHLYDFVLAKNPKDEMLFLLARALTYARKTQTAEDGRIEELNPDFGKVRSYIIPELEEQLSNYRVDDKKLEQDEVIAFGLIIWYLEKKMAGYKTKVFKFNILADKSEDIISVDGEKTIKTKSFSMREKIIG